MVMNQWGLLRVLRDPADPMANYNDAMLNSETDIGLVRSRGAPNVRFGRTSVFDRFDGPFTKTKFKKI